jgi:hypothetical protein
MKKPTAKLLFSLLIPAILFASSVSADTYKEIEFLKTFAGKDGEFVQQTLGAPDSVVKKENAGGSVEFWVYHDLVHQGSSDKLYRFTQIGIVNGAIETLGHTNRQPK